PPEPAGAPGRGGGVPAGGRMGRAEAPHLVDPRGAVAAIAAKTALRLLHLDMRLGQLVDESRRNGRRPGAVDAAVRHEIDLGPLARPGEADMGEAALLLESGAALLVERALVRQHALLPARQENRGGHEPLARAA